ncbi:MAG TPA: lipid II flippase MurJ [Verrucomicrobiae bacterium]|nr:lipid II flippase MurJ [Verrucomicrobiae bacterium]
MTEAPKEYGIRRATLALALGSLAARGLGFLREVVVAAKFGTGRAFDLYVAASAFPTVLSSIFHYALPDYLIPYFARLKESRPAALRRFLLWVLLGGTAFLGVLYFSAPLCVKLFAPGLAAVEIPFSVRAFQILLLFVFGTAMEAVLRSFYQMEGRFGLTALSPLLTAAAVFGFVVLFSGKLSVYALAWGWAAGGLLPAALLFGALFFYPPAASPVPVEKSADVEPEAAAWKGFSYVLLIAVLGQLMVLLDRFFGSFLPPASLSALYYASLPVQLPIALLIYPLGQAVFPKLSARLAEGKNQEAAELFAKTLGWLNFVLIPMSVLFILAPQEIIRLIYERGVFGASSTGLGAVCLRAFAFSLLASGYIFVLSRVFLAAGRGKRLALFCLGALSFKCLAAYPAIRLWGLEGLAGAGSAALVGLALVQFRRRPETVRFPAGRRLGPDGFKLLFVSLLAFAGAWLARLFFMGGSSLVQEILLLLVFGFLYLAGCYIFKIPELLEGLQLIRRWGGRSPYGVLGSYL